MNRVADELRQAISFAFRTAAVSPEHDVRACRVEWSCTGAVDRVDILLWIRGGSAKCFRRCAISLWARQLLGSSGGAEGAKANYGSFVFTVPLKLPSSSYYEAEVRCSDAGDVVGMLPVFSVAHDQKARAAAADDTADFATFILHVSCL
jgi:hypothetical protein